MRTPRPPWLLVLAVLALHLLLGHEVQRIHEGWLSDGPPPMPARMQVALVREMQLQPPAPLRAPPPAPRPTPKPRAAVATQPASAPEPPAPPASAPEPALQAASAPVDPPTAVTQAASAPVNAEPGPEWPLSTRLSYVLTGNYRGPVSGQAQVEWLRKGSDYQVNLDVGVGPSFAPLISRRMSSQGQLTPEGIAPQRYDEETRFIVGGGHRATVFFLGAEVQLASGVREPAPRGGQDSASQFVQLTWLFMTGREPLQAGRSVQFPLVLPRRQYAWQYEVLGEEVLDTPMGAVASWHLKPTRAPAGGDLSAEVWLAPTLQYLPLRLVIRQDADTYIDLMLKSAPLQEAAPESTSIPRRLSQ